MGETQAPSGLVEAKRAKRLDEPRIRLKPGELRLPVDKVTALAIGDFIADEVEEGLAGVEEGLGAVLEVLKDIRDELHLARSVAAQPLVSGDSTSPVTMNEAGEPEPSLASRLRRPGAAKRKGK